MTQGIGFTSPPAVGTATGGAVVAVALLYLVTEELLVEAYEVPETPLSTAMFFIGSLPCCWLT
jgi:ZIP family zinc transporter